MSKKDEEKYDEEIKEIVIHRLLALPENIRISVGSKGKFNKEELIERVKKGDEIGKLIIKIQLNYLRSLKKGIIVPT